MSTISIPQETSVQHWIDKGHLIAVNVLTEPQVETTVQSVSEDQHDVPRNVPTEPQAEATVQSVSEDQRDVPRFNAERALFVHGRIAYYRMLMAVFDNWNRLVGYRLVPCH